MTKDNDGCLYTIHGWPTKTHPPKHYDLGGGKDIHDIERAIWGDEAHAKHLLMAAFEYIARAHKKGSNIDDIGKAINCLQKAKRIVEEQGK